MTKQTKQETIKANIKKIEGECETCGNEGVCWLLSPCPDCKEGRKMKKIGDKITKDINKNKIRIRKKILKWKNKQ